MSLVSSATDLTVLILMSVLKKEMNVTKGPIVSIHMVHIIVYVSMGFSEMVSIVQMLTNVK